MSSTVTVRNNTPNTIERGGDPEAFDGHYETYPPAKIAAYTEVTWCMRPNYRMAGSAGDVTYYVPQARIDIAWNCPPIGSGSNAVSVENSNSRSVTASLSNYMSKGNLSFIVTITSN
ncbi:hypothetical protein B0H13DRAFT_2331766 [Mycena leptocephala]|nr:hypothetical protein B0H13DRAFT_2331766 [Mycena leptocephala]